MLQEWKPDRSNSLTLVGIAVVFCVLVIASVSVGVRTLSVGILTFLAVLTLEPYIGAVALTVVGYRLVIHGTVLLASYATNSFLTIGCGFLCMAAGIFFKNLVEMVRQFRERRKDMKSVIRIFLILFLLFALAGVCCVGIGFSMGDNFRDVSAVSGEIHESF